MYISRYYPPSTRHTFAHDWRPEKNYCFYNGVPSIPCIPETYTFTHNVCMYNMHNQLFLVTYKNNKYDNSSNKSVSTIFFLYQLSTIIIMYC